MWWNKSLLAKLVIGMLIAAVIPLTLSITISYQSTVSSVREQVIDLNQQAMDSSTYYLKRYLDDLNRISISFYYDQAMMSYLRQQSLSFNERLYISDQIYAISMERQEFRAVRFTSAITGDVFTNSVFLQIGDASLMPPSTPDRDPAGWTETHGYETVSVGGETLLAFHKPIIDYPRTTQLGVLSIFVGPDEFERLIRPVSPAGLAEGERVFLMVRGDRKLLYATEKPAGSGTAERLAAVGAEGGRGYADVELDGREGLFVYVTDVYKSMPLTLVKFVPESIVNEAADRALQQSLAIPFLTTGIVLICALLLSYVLIAPVKRLVRNIAKVQAGDFDMPLPAPARRDELGVLEHRFHAMVRGLDDLMNREYRSRLELTTARLKMLQAQINPHFLYNSLQSIGTLALRQGAHDVNDKIAELGAIMRYSMDLQTESVPLQREIEHIEHYLSLQTGRFKHKLSYTLSCPDEARGMEVPKMILQPLVENSIVHGIERGSGSGTIHIGIELGDGLVIRVMDNGKGMERETIERIRREYNGRQAADGRERGIGLLNVLVRLRLRCGPDFKWEIHSVPYEATVITLYLPADRAAEDDESEGAPSGRPDDQERLKRRNEAGEKEGTK